MNAIQGSKSADNIDTVDETVFTSSFNAMTLPQHAAIATVATAVNDGNEGSADANTDANTAPLAATSATSAASNTSSASNEAGSQAPTATGTNSNGSGDTVGAFAFDHGNRRNLNSRDGQDSHVNVDATPIEDAATNANASAHSHSHSHPLQQEQSPAMNTNYTNDTNGANTNFANSTNPTTATSTANNVGNINNMNNMNNMSNMSNMSNISNISNISNMDKTGMTVVHPVDPVVPASQVPITAAASTDSPWIMGGTNTRPISHLHQLSQSLHSHTNASASAHNNNANVSTSTRPSSAFTANQRVEIGMRVRETPSPLSTPSTAPEIPSNPNHLPNIPLLNPTNHSDNINSIHGNHNNTTTQTHNQTQPQQQSMHSNDHVKSKYEDKLSNLGLTHPSEPVESVLAAACASIGFDIVEMWLRTGPKTHQLIHSHLRYSALDDTTRTALVDVYYGDNAPNRAHKLSPALCKKARANNNIVWVTAQTYYGAQALKCSLSGVLSAVAVPICHEESQTNMTVIYFSMKRATMQPVASEFLIHMSLAAAIVSVNIFDHDLIQQQPQHPHQYHEDEIHDYSSLPTNKIDGYQLRDSQDTSCNFDGDSAASGSSLSHTASYAAMEHKYNSMNVRAQLSQNMQPSLQHQLQHQQTSSRSLKQSSQIYHNHNNATIATSIERNQQTIGSSKEVQSVVTLPTDLHQDMEARTRSNSLTNVPPNISTNVITNTAQTQHEYSITGAHMNVNWNDLRNVEYLTDGGNNWIHTAVMNNQPVVIKQLKPEVHDVVSAMDEIEGELRIHSQLDHRNIVSLHGAGHDRNGARFLVLERLDGGTLSQMMGHDTRIRDRRRRFFRKKEKIPYVDVLKYAQQIAAALDYLHRNAIEGSMIIHRDLKPDNIGTYTSCIYVCSFFLPIIFIIFHACVMSLTNLNFLFYYRFHTGQNSQDFGLWIIYNCTRLFP